ncbi:MAG TPA: prepilin-type N-terminal cleavage/methylation domain-containing protein [Bryobacteraceae bacterium]|nr:prepilin-type N-terminal cleavage/methylation domain-containing protein [Bryobacteraceae bacterium]
MTRPSHREAGVTLIEILIAVSLLSLLSLGVLIAMRIGFSTLDKVDSRLVADRRVSYARRILESEIAGFTLASADWRPGTPDNRILAFTQWEPQTMRFVTSYSLQDSWRGRLQIVALQVIPGEEGKGVRLIVNETPYTGSLQAGSFISSIDPDGTTHFAPVTAGPQSFVLADHLAYCRFSYLVPKPEAPYQEWMPGWITRGRLPMGVRVEMAPLDTDPSRLHPSTMVAALHVNRTPGVYYADQF